MEAGKAKTRFDMEQEIMQAWQVLDDIKMLSAREGGTQWVDCIKFVLKLCLKRLNK